MYPLWSLLFLGGTVLAAPPLYPRNNGTSSVYSPSGTAYVVGTAASQSVSVSRNATSVATAYSSATATASFGGDYVFPTERLGPIPTLQPVIPDTVDVNDVNRLTPCEAGSGDALHYLQSPSPGSAGTYAIATPNWKAPSVVLDHSAAIRQVQMHDSSGNLVVYFMTREAFEHAASQWDPSKNIIFVTYTPGCGNFDSDERCYYQSNSISFYRDSLSAVATGNSKSIHDVTNHVELQWGDYNQGYSFSGGGATPTSTNGVSTISLSTPTGAPNCTAPVDTKYGLPTACLGYKFDGTLDNNLGLYNLSHFEYADAVADIALEFGDDTSTGTAFGKRQNPFQAGLRIVKEKSAATFQATKRAAQGVADTVKVGVKKIEQTVVNAGQDLQANLRASFDQFKGVVSDIQGGAEALVSFLKGQPIEIPFDEEPKDLTLPRPKSECEGSSSKAKRAPTKSNQTPRKTKASKQKKDKKEKKDACEPKEGAKGVESPWGDKAVLIKSFGKLPEEKDLRPSGSRRQTTVRKGGFLNIYCVSCGLTGSLTTTGSIIFSTSGIIGGRLDGNIPNMAVGVGLGVYAEYVNENSFRTNLYDIPLSPFTIGFATIGPVLSVGTHLKFGVKMSGNIHARADVKFENSRFSYDFKTKEFSQSGFTPKFTPGFSAEGQVELTAGFGVPIGIELALTVGPCGACKGSIGIATEPTIEVSATVAIEAQFEPGAKKLNTGIKPIDGCKGVTVDLSARNYLVGTLRSFSLFSDTNRVLHTSPALKLANTCIPIGKQKRGLPALPDAEGSQVHRRQDTNSTSNSTGSTYDMTEYVVSTVDELEYVEYYNAEVPYTYEDDTDSESHYWVGTVELLESGDSILFSSCNDGNVYMQTTATYYDDLTFYQTCSTLWAGYDDVIVSTPNGAMLHYYNNTMSKIGVSRLRTAPVEEIPETSVYVALAPFEYADNSSILAAVDLDGNVFFPVLCTYKGEQGAKIYLVNEDIDAGIAMLKSPDVTYSITNGQVDNCQLLFLGISDRPDGTWAVDDTEVETAYEQEPLIWEFNSTLFDGEDELNESLFDEVQDVDLDFTDVFDDEFWLDFLEEDLEEEAAEEAALES